MRHDVRMHNITPQQRCREICQAESKTGVVKRVGQKCSTPKPRSLVSVTACQGKTAVCQGLKVPPPDIFAPQRHPNLYPYPGYCAEGIPLPRVLCRRSYRTYRSSGYGYGCLTELTEVPGTGIKPLQNSQKFRVLWPGRTELTEVPVRYKNVVPVPRVL